MSNSTGNATVGQVTITGGGIERTVSPTCTTAEWSEAYTAVALAVLKTQTFECHCATRGSCDVPYTHGPGW